MRCLSLFSGIGGIDLAAQAVGFEVVAFCESDPFCRAVLSTHWPHIPIYHEVKEVSYARLQRDGRLPIDLVFGGPPCQPASLAGKRRGARDERWLWPELLRVVGELRPRWCVAENPLGILSIDAGRAWERFLEPWSRWGIVVDGVYGALLRWERRTAASVSSSSAIEMRTQWPTPRARDAQAESVQGGIRHYARYHSMMLATAASLWPT